jgi:putative peptidoglycan lipid II flippase
VLVDVLSPGCEGEKRELTIALVRILYPGAALLVWSAWCLGVLNSHGRFFLSYAAPVLWNATMIAAMFVRGPGRDVAALAMDLAWASVLGSALVVALQAPVVLRLLGSLRLTLGRQSQHVRAVLHNFGPVLLGRGVVQLSAYVDVAIASLIAGGAAAILGYAQLLYLLPVSLFGMAVTAAELPAMSSGVGDQATVARHVRGRLSAGADRIAFFVIPSAAALLAIGDLLGIILYRGGRFGSSETVWVWRTLGGAAIGLVAATLGRLYASAFYAIRDTRTPVRFALLRVAVSVVLGITLALVVPRALDLAPLWGVAGLTLASSVGAWVEYALLRRSLGRRLPQSDRGTTRGVARLWLAAAGAAAAAWLLRWLLVDGEPGWLMAVALTFAFGTAYLLMAAAFGYQEVGQLLARVRRGGRGSRRR